MWPAAKQKLEGVSRAVEEAKHGTEVNVKLDMIMKSTDATAKTGPAARGHGRYEKAKFGQYGRLKDIEKRVDKLEVNLGKLHAEHREHMQNIREAKEIGAYSPLISLFNNQNNSFYSRSLKDDKRLI